MYSDEREMVDSKEIANINKDDARSDVRSDAKSETSSSSERGEKRRSRSNHNPSMRRSGASSSRRYNGNYSSDRPRKKQHENSSIGPQVNAGGTESSENIVRELSEEQIEQIKTALTDEDKTSLNSKDLKSKKINELAELAGKLHIEHAAGLRRQDLVFEVLKRAARFGNIYGNGVLEILSDGYGFLRSPDYNYLPGPDDIYVSPSQIKRFGLRTGDDIAGTVRPPKDNERYFALLKVETLNKEKLEASKEKLLFDNLTPLYPKQKLTLEHDPANFTTRVIDMMAPLGKGQRALIVAPPRTGKTVILQDIANAITINHP